MAKPIPLNRRWVQNQQARAEAAADPTAAATPVVREQAQRLQAIICAALNVPEPDDEVDPIELVRAYLQEPLREADAVLYARFESQCPGCGEPIQVGDPIVRHPQWGRYVHAHCRNRQQRAAVAYTIVARYPWHMPTLRAARPPRRAHHTSSPTGLGSRAVRAAASARLVAPVQEPSAAARISPRVRSAADFPAQRLAQSRLQPRGVPQRRPAGVLVQRFRRRTADDVQILGAAAQGRTRWSQRS
jgi:hypothetical protein